MKNNIVDMYLSGISALQISKTLNMKYYRVHKIIKDSGIVFRKNGDNFKKYLVNHDFFEIIDTEEKAYWLGFIAADGHVSRGDQVVITQSTENRDHLQKFLNSIEATNKIRDYVNDTPYKKNTKYSRIVITSKKMVEDLSKLNIVENKSLILVAPDISDSLKRHWIRGYIDGDGSISRTKSKNKKIYEYSLKICGTKEVLTSILSYLGKENQKLYERNYDNKNNYYISIGGNIQTKECLDIIYGDSTIYMDRKYKRYTDLIAQSSKGVTP